MEKHNTLYYLFLEDQQKNTMDIKARENIRRNVEEYYRQVKPPWKQTELFTETKRACAKKQKPP